MGHAPKYVLGARRRRALRRVHPGKDGPGGGRDEPHGGALCGLKLGRPLECRAGGPRRLGGSRSAVRADRLSLLFGLPGSRGELRQQLRQRVGRRPDAVRACLEPRLGAVAPPPRRAGPRDQRAYPPRRRRRRRRRRARRTSTTAIRPTSRSEWGRKCACTTWGATAPISAPETPRCSTPRSAPTASRASPGPRTRTGRAGRRASSPPCRCPATASSPR
mmetsp:Transcript_41024/g.92346  ORF Transcript_41024/g.92346 Transcript_41024/m.92346 type:complete len:219 (+) Transcript_41024:172-828(+)